MRALLLLLVLAFASSGCFGSTAGPKTEGHDKVGLLSFGPPLPDPLADGPFKFSIKEYDQGMIKVGGRTHEHKNYTYDAKLRGVLFTPEGPGPFPVLVFLHGQHPTCGFAGREQIVASPLASCDTAGEPWHVYPNHRGYDYLGKHLASHGFVVASINGKEVNDRNGQGDIGMWARGELIIGTLDLLREAHEGTKDLGLAGKLDLDRIGIMGHSRGGEGVVTATHVNALRTDPYNIRAVIPLAPTDFNYRGVKGSALLSILPYCDGDVYSLHGLRTYDHSRFVDDAAKVQIVVFGTNHNNYNSQWGRMVGGVVPDGDDSLMFSRHNNPDCDVPQARGGGKLSLDDVYREATLHIGGFFRWVVGNETALAPYFQGDAAMPAKVCPGGAGPCPNAVRVTSVLPGRNWIFNVTKDGVGRGAVSLEGFSATNHCSMSRCAGNVYSYAWALDLTWNQPATLHAALPEGHLVGMDAIAFRAGLYSWGKSNDPRMPVDASVVLIDRAGQGHSQRVSAHSKALAPPPGEVIEETTPTGTFARVGETKVTYNMVRLPLSAFDVDPADVVAMEIRFDQTKSGRILIADAWAQPEHRLALAD
ncbi:MAG TPA: hypothetical protein VI818_03740 [Candidatus Thermoplasmatota archaeon]|nr:hypothetical protein [Candidatus Thermoplasmatota archaeon]